MIGELLFAFKVTMGDSCICSGMDLSGILIGWNRRRRRQLSQFLAMDFTIASRL